MNNKPTILIVEDENNICGFMTTILTINNYNVLRASDGSGALMMISSYCPDLVILDLGLPDIDGMQIISSVRKWSSVPIIVVSARFHERDKVEALDMGADDYVTKPFGTSELLARVRTALRHVRSNDVDENVSLTGVFKTGGLVINYEKRQVFVENEQVHLTQNEYKIVTLLSKYPGRVLTYDYLMKNIWGPNTNGDNQILRVNMANIRRKIEKNPAEPKYILTEIGVGYRMSEG